MYQIQKRVTGVLEEVRRAVPLAVVAIVRVYSRVDSLRRWGVGSDGGGGVFGDDDD